MSEPIAFDDTELLKKFTTPSLKVNLKITDLKTMKCHHTWLWTFKNIKLEPQDKLFFGIEGDIPQNFEDLNLKIHDEKDRKLQVEKLEDKPLEKSFNVKLERPIKFNREQTIKLEYDWDEPKMNYVMYPSYGGFDKIEFSFSIPKNANVDARLFKLHSGSKSLVFIPTPIKIKKLKNTISIKGNMKRVLATKECLKFYWRIKKTRTKKVSKK